MWSKLVVGVSEPVEDTLLQVEVGGWRFGGLGLERLVHAFMSAVLLRAARCDALVSDPELEPPDVEVAEPVNPGRSERSAVVAADRVGETVLPKQAQELRFDALSCARPRARGSTAGTG